MEALAVSTRSFLPDWRLRNKRGFITVTNLLRGFSWAVLLLLFTPLLPAQSDSKLDYTITFSNAARHLVHVNMTYDAASGGVQVQLPVWNALYQVRDFAKNII